MLFTTSRTARCGSCEKQSLQNIGDRELLGHCRHTSPRLVLAAVHSYVKFKMSLASERIRMKRVGNRSSCSEGVPAPYHQSLASRSSDPKLCHKMMPKGSPELGWYTMSSRKPEISQSLCGMLRQEIDPQRLPPICLPPGPRYPLPCLTASYKWFTGSDACVE